MQNTHPFLPEDLYAVIGWPLSHSLSPFIHTIGFQTLGIPAVYMKFAIEESSLASFMTSVRTLPIKGLSVTIPHKRAIIQYLDEMTEEVQRIGACNTLFWKGQTLCGDNTDYTGFLAPIATLPLSSLRVLLLGAGGAARAALCALTTKGVKDLMLATPSNTRHIALAQEFQVGTLSWEERMNYSCDLLINATPLGMKNAHENETPYDFSRAKNIPQYAYDIVYTPLETRFLREARSHGVETCISGEEMFFEQGSAQFQLWTGKSLPYEAKEALHRALR
ncbi:MAG: shikimate dehydrogenase [Desulfovibrio sp.]|nr:shikimate dehydrogenase [Desulfovibrio sp.]